MGVGKEELVIVFPCSEMFRDPCNSSRSLGRPFLKFLNKKKIRFPHDIAKNSSLRTTNRKLSLKA